MEIVMLVNCKQYFLQIDSHELTESTHYFFFGHRHHNDVGLDASICPKQFSSATLPHRF